MGARPRTIIRCMSALAVVAICIAGCALELDYGPPNGIGTTSDTGQGGLDAGRRDGGGHRDAGPGGACDAGCDDGLRCTADNCATTGMCTHTDLCPDGTDCVARNGGECRRPCTAATDCDDNVSCTADTCASDGHCAHDSTCPTGAPVCLDNGVCVPEHCMSDGDCSDGNACNGVESCTAATCHAGAAVTCSSSVGCELVHCDTATGGCVVQHDATMCDDGRACTVDTCVTGGQCTHTPNDAPCASPNRCASFACRPDMTTDPSGCMQVGAVTCSTSACGVAPCEPTTGMCNPDAACPMGEICSAMGCVAPNQCATDQDCSNTHTVAGCATSCQSGMCLPLTCMLPPPGSCGVLLVDSLGCPHNGMCTLVPSDDLCADADPSSVDTCDPGMLTCVHTCPGTPNSCETFVYDGTMCASQRDASFCTSVHGAPSLSNCAAWVCAGAGGGGGTDGCMAVASNAACDDHAACTDDVCTLGTDGAGTCAHQQVATRCDDGLDCTRDACAPGSVPSASGCIHMPDDNVCTAGSPMFGCATPYCAQIPANARIGPLPTGCALRYDTTRCGGGLCASDGRCVVVACGVGTSCDDGNLCNGTEHCSGTGMGTCIQQPPTANPCPTSASGCPRVCTPTGCVDPLIAACGFST